VDHFSDLELLVVQIEHRSVELDEWTALSVSAADATVLIYDSVNVPPELDKASRDALAQAPVEEKFRRLV
jgi:hypothetical protein